MNTCGRCGHKLLWHGDDGCTKEHSYEGSTFLCSCLVLVRLEEEGA